MVDLGADVPASEIVDMVKERNPDIVGLSALTTFTMGNMGDVMKALESNGLRDKVKVIIGGAPVTPQFAQQIGADHAALNAIEGVHKCMEWLGAATS